MYKMKLFIDLYRKTYNKHHLYCCDSPILYLIKQKRLRVRFYNDAPLTNDLT